MSELSNIPGSWYWQRVEDICSAIVDCEHSTAKFTNNGVPCLDTTCIRPNQIVFDKLRFVSEETFAFRVRRTIPRVGDLIFAREGTVGTVVMIPDDFKCCLGQRVMLLRPGDRVYGKFLEYALLSDQIRMQYRPMILGTTSPHLNVKDVKILQVPVAPTEEQRRIVSKIEELFSALDAGVAALQRAKANLKRYRAAVLKAAVEGKLTEAWRAKHPKTEPASKLLERILTERRQKWEADQLAKFAAAGKQPPKNWREKYVEPSPPETSGLPELPKGWCWASMEQLCSRSEYGTSVKCDYEGSGPPVLRIPNIAAGNIELNDLKYAAQSLELETEDSLQPGDLLMCRTNGSISLIGKAAVIRSKLPRPHSFASYLLRFRFMAPTILPIWIHTFISSFSGRHFIERNAASSAGQHNISLSLIHRMPIPLAPTNEQARALEEVEERLSVIASAETAITRDLLRATRLRQSILKQAFEGKLVPQDPSDEPVSKTIRKSAIQPVQG